MSDELSQDTVTPDGTDPAAPVDTSPQSPEDTLGADDSALPDWAKQKIAKANREAANLRQRLKDAEPLIESARAAEEATKSEVERAREAAAAAGEQVGKYRDRAVRAEAKALAAADFASADVAIRLLDLPTYVSDDGDIDTEQIKADLAGLLEREPYLGRSQESREMKPNRAQGRSGALSIDQQIAEAEKSRDIARTIHLKRLRAHSN